MTLLFIDGFDHYSTVAEGQTKWDATFATQTWTTNGGRDGGGGVNFPFSNAYYLTKNLPTNPTKVTCGFAWKPTTGGTTRSMMYFYNSVGNMHGHMRRNSDNTISMLNAGGTVLGTTAATVTDDVWTYIELQMSIDDTTGTCKVQINGVLEIDFTGDTRWSTYPVDISQVTIVLHYMTSVMDDVYILDDTGSISNDFLGDVRVALIMPDGDSSNDFTAVGTGTTNADRVDETAQDGDTTYVESATVADEEKYTYAALPSDTGTVHGVQVVPYAKKTATGGVKTLRTLAYSVSTEATGVTVGLTDDYIYIPQIFEQDPDASAAWTKTTVDAATFGFEIVS